MSKRAWASVLAVALALFSSPLSAAIVYVNGDAAGTNTGTSWTNAYLLLQSALDAATSGDEIWVAAGTYKPTSDYGLVASGTDVQDRLKHFRMKNGVGIYGGFAGTENLRTQRNWTANITTLSGDIGADGTTGDNCYHLFYHLDAGLDTTAVLDGFTVCYGNANGSYPHSDAGGMLNHESSPTVTNCTFDNNWTTGYGGGMNNDASSPVIANCSFHGNAGSYGGGMFNQNSSSPSITDGTFSSNGATYGGGIYNSSSSPTVTNCTFTFNAADSSGGGVDNQGEDSSPVFTACTFNGNSANSGGGMYNYDSAAPTVAGCTFYNNTATSTGGGMFNTDASPIITNCAFIGNSCTGAPTIQYGGGMYNDTSAAVVTNCLFTGNSGNYGGGMCATGAPSPTVTNCSFNGNSAAFGGAMFNWTDCAATVFNCVFWGDSVTTAGAEVYNLNGTATFHHCDIDTCGGSGAGWVTGIGTDGGGNIEADPLYVDAAGGDLQLQVGSPCIDAADGAAAPDHDKNGNPRVDDPGTVNTGANTPDYADIGAYEYEPIPIKVTYPSDSGISLERGKICNIEWVTILPLGTRFKIELLKGSGGMWPLAANASKTPLKWTVGKAIKGVEMYPDGDDYLIRVSTLSDSDAAVSDYYFSIGTVNSLTVSGLTTDVTAGNSAQFDCTAHYQDGFGADRVVTNEVKWSCSKIKGVKIGKTGLLATAPGVVAPACTITATYGKGKPPITGTLDITVGP